MRHFTKSGLCSCGCHAQYTRIRILHCTPCCSPPKKMGFNRSDLMDWLKPYLILIDNNKVSGFILRVSHEALRFMCLNEDEWSFTGPDVSHLFGLEIQVHDFEYKPEELLIAVYYLDRMVEIRELTQEAEGTHKT